MATNDERSKVVWLAAIMPPMFVGAGSAGFLFDFGLAGGAIFLVVGAGVAAGLHGRSSPMRAMYFPAFLAIGVGATLATSLYCDGRSSILNYELFIPVLAGAIPGALLVWAMTSWIAPRFEGAGKR